MVSPRINFRLPARGIQRIDQLAEREGVTRSEQTRRLVLSALAHRDRTNTINTIYPGLLSDSQTDD